MGIIDDLITKYVNGSPGKNKVENTGMPLPDNTNPTPATDAGASIVPPAPNAETSPVPSAPNAETPPVSTTPDAGTSPVPSAPDAGSHAWDNYLKSDDLIQAINNYDALKHGSAVEYYNKLFTKPEPVDEKKAEKARLFASIGDALGLFSQMWSAGRGAHVRNRNYEQSAGARLEKAKKELDGIYRKRLDDYNRGIYGATMTDYNDLLQFIRDTTHKKYEYEKDKKNREFQKER
jgi:hypothetical protein